MICRTVGDLAHSDQSVAASALQRFGQLFIWVTDRKFVHTECSKLNRGRKKNAHYVCSLVVVDMSGVVQRFWTSCVSDGQV